MTEQETLALADVNALVGDDVLYWLTNPFMTPEMLAEKVCWWMTKARAEDAALLAEAREAVLLLAAAVPVPGGVAARKQEAGE